MVEKIDSKVRNAKTAWDEAEKFDSLEHALIFGDEKKLKGLGFK